MSETVQYLSDYLKELESYMKRLDRDGLSRKDQQLFFELSNEYYDIFQKTKDFPTEILRGMSEFSDNIMNQSGERKELAKGYQANIVKSANAYIDASRQNELQIGIFRADAEILRLQSEKIQMMQELVNLDVKLYGQITEQTQEILEVQNCEVLSGRVRELGQWEQEDLATEIEEIEQMDKTGQSEEANMEKRVISGDELDQILNNHLSYRQSEREAKMLDLSNCIISNYIFKGDLSTVSLDGSELRYCEFRMTKAEHISLRNAIFTDCKLTQAEFEHCNFNNADINNTGIRNSMFRECSFDETYMRQSPIRESVFYRTSFTDTRLRECLGSENIFYGCGHPEETVRLDTAAMDQEEFEHYADSIRDMFNNEGYAYSWELNEVDPKNYTADLSIKISQDGEIVEVDKYSALLNPDTYAISHIDTGRQEDSLVKMFMPEMNAIIAEKIQEQERKPIKLNFPYMSRDTFMKVKEEIRRMGAEFDSTHKVWYVYSNAGRETIDNIQDYLMKNDEAIYLKLPPLSPRQFKKITDQLKKDGARYNPDKKAWYITEKAEQSKFQKYLPTVKESIHEKLNGYKAAMQHTGDYEMASREKEMSERA